MVDLGNNTDKTSQDIAAEAGTHGWTPGDYSDHGEEYDGEAMSEAVEAFESFPVYEKELVADGGRELDPRVRQAGELNPKVLESNGDDSGYGTRKRDWSDHQPDYDEAGEVLGTFLEESPTYTSIEEERDRRLEEAENSEFKIEM